MVYHPLLTDIADRERMANQSRTLSLLTWVASLGFIGLGCSPIAKAPETKAALFIASAVLTATSYKSAENLATHDRVLQDHRDIADNQRQQLIYETLNPKAIATAAELPPIAAALPVHNISRTISSELKSTVVLGAPRAGKGYAIAKAVELLSDDVDIWLIDPKHDPNESFYWRRIPMSQRVRFDVTTLEPEAVDDKVLGLFTRFLAAPSSSSKPKLLIVDEDSPGLAMGMTGKAFKAFMGRLATICSVGPSKGNFVWIMAQASTVDDLAMSNGNKASFRLTAVGHAQRTENSWYRSLKRSMGIEMPSDQLTGYIQMLNSQWGYAEPFSLEKTTAVVKEPSDKTVELTTEQKGLIDFLSNNASESFSLRQLTGKGFAKRLDLRSMETMGQLAASLLSLGIITAEDKGGYRIVEDKQQ